MKSIAIAAAALSGTAGLGCGGDDGPGPLTNVDALVILQRPKRNDTGDIFQYTSYIPGARLVKLSPPTADGTLTPICCDQAGPEFANADINGYDISFDATKIVFAAKLSETTRYGLYLLHLDTGVVDQIPTDPQRDYVAPIFVPGDYIMFTTNAVVELGAPQHRDEYERGVTTQIGRVRLDGSGMELGPRNLSHRSLPSLTSDGRIIFTQWDHLGRENAGHLMFMNPDMQNLREAFGKEGTEASNSTLKAQEIAPGRFVAIATARNRTVQAGSLIDVRLGTVVTDKDGNVSAADKMAEARATYQRLTPDVPVDNMPSADTVGRYYDAYPLNAKDKPDLLVSWADGPVESSVLGAAGLAADFGVYLYDSKRQQRLPILDDHMMWDIFPRPLAVRTAPPLIESATDPNLLGAAEIGALNVYDSTLAQFAPGSVYGVRVAEGFSSEEGFPERFGATEFEGQAILGVAKVESDGSWRAKIPGNVPVHIQAIDTFGMSLKSEPVWFSARAGEARVCGGCHEDRTKAVTVQPGVNIAFSKPPVDMLSTKPRFSRASNDYSRDKLVGVPWDDAIQRIFDAKCVSCHGDSNAAGIPGYTLMDPTTGQTLTITFNLCGFTPNANCAGGLDSEMLGDNDLGTWKGKSYMSLVGPDPEAIERGGIVVSAGTMKQYLNPEDARNSLLIKMLNPVQQFPTQNPNVRAFQTVPHMVAKGGTDLTPDEFYALIATTDLGANFYYRENNPDDKTYTEDNN